MSALKKPFYISARNIPNIYICRFHVNILKVQGHSSREKGNTKIRKHIEFFLTARLRRGREIIESLQTTFIMHVFL